MPPAVDFGASPKELYRAITALDDEEFQALMAEPKSRAKVIDALVDFLAGRLRPDRARDVDAVIHVKLWDKPGGGYDHREIVIRNGACTVSETPEEEPRLTLKIRPTDLRSVISGDAGPKRLAFRGRLRAVGDIGLGMRLGELFDFNAEG
jgi:alkyl sulfatase BDS1-like metallo-beta-lactamase superfamily hydrolase